MTDRKDRAELSEERIEALLAQMADEAPAPSLALMERIVSDAQDVARARDRRAAQQGQAAQHRQAELQGAQQVVDRDVVGRDAGRAAGAGGRARTGTGRGGLGGWLANLLAPIGGWPAVAGLATATVAGGWIGYASGDGLSGLTGDAISAGGGADLGEFMLSYDDLLGEG